LVLQHYELLGAGAVELGDVLDACAWMLQPGCGERAADARAEVVRHVTTAVQNIKEFEFTERGSGILDLPVTALPQKLIVRLMSF
jgi:hypothetical protein